MQLIKDKENKVTNKFRSGKKTNKQTILYLGKISQSP